MKNQKYSSLLPALPYGFNPHLSINLLYYLTGLFDFSIKLPRPIYLLENLKYFMDLNFLKGDNHGGEE